MAISSCVEASDVLSVSISPCSLVISFEFKSGAQLSVLPESSSNTVASNTNLFICSLLSKFARLES